MNFDVLDRRLEPPVVVAADVAERHPDAGMELGVVHLVLAGDGRMVARDLRAIGRVDVGEVGTRDLGVVVEVRGEGFAADGDFDLAGLLVEVRPVRRSSASERLPQVNTTTSARKRRENPPECNIAARLLAVSPNGRRRGRCG